MKHFFRRERRPGSRVYQRFIKGYTFVALLLSVIYLLLLEVVQFRQFREKQEKIISDSFAAGVNELNSNFHDLHTIAARIAGNDVFSVRKISGENASPDAVDYLQLYEGYSHLASELILVYGDPQVKHTYCAGTAFRLSEFDKIYRCADLTVEDLQQYAGTLKTPLLIPTAIAVGLNVKDVYLYVIPISAYFPSMPAVLVGVIDPSGLSGPLRTRMGDTEYSFSLRDASGRDVFRSGTLTQEQPDDIVLESRADTFGGSFRLVCRKPSFGPQSVMPPLYLSILGAIFLVGLLLSVLAAHYTYQPIKIFFRNVLNDGGTADSAPQENEFLRIEQMIETLKREPPVSLRTLLTYGTVREGTAEALGEMGITPESTLLLLLLRPAAGQLLSEAEIAAWIGGAGLDGPAVLTASLGADGVSAALLAWSEPPSRPKLLKKLHQAQKSRRSAGGQFSVLVGRSFQDIDSIQLEFYRMLYVSNYQAPFNEEFTDIDTMLMLPKNYVSMQENLLFYELHLQLSGGDFRESEKVLETLSDEHISGKNPHEIDAAYSTLLSVFRQLGEEEPDDEFNAQIQEMLTREVRTPGEFRQAAAECLQLARAHYRNTRKKLDLQAILAAVDSRCSDMNFSLKELAGKYEVSESTLSRFFKKEVGLGLNAYLTKLRIETAKKLLSETEDTIKEIAAAAGYNDINNFNRRFKSSVGCTPSEYRENSKTEG